MRFWLCATSVLWENHGADTCITWGLSWGACALSAHGDLFGARALSGKRFSGGEQLLCLCLSWDAVGVGYQGGGSVSPSGV